MHANWIQLAQSAIAFYLDLDFSIYQFTFFTYAKTSPAADLSCVNLISSYLNYTRDFIQ